VLTEGMPERKELTQLEHKDVDAQLSPPMSSRTGMAVLTM